MITAAEMRERGLGLCNFEFRSFNDIRDSDINRGRSSLPLSVEL